ncbi:hypothetical protein BGZ63DRAFT_169798 [Mariannaea sp. PMI_226]|nr:hypothetical protein BGZ63DRAFT_169798 [Mariannaea sp. PMI_226]
MISTLTYNPSQWQWQTPSRPPSPPTPLLKDKATLLSFSSLGTSFEPICIPSDVDSDTEDSGDDKRADDSQFDTALPPASSLAISITRSQPRNMGHAERAGTVFVDLVGAQPVILPTLDQPAIPNVVIGSPKSAPQGSIDASTSSSESPAPVLPLLDSDKAPCQENGPETPTLPTDEAPRAANVVAEWPRTVPNCDADSADSRLASPEPRLTPDLRDEALRHSAPECRGQASNKVNVSKPISITHDDIQAAAPASSLLKASDNSASEPMPQLLATLPHTVQDSSRTSDLPLSTNPSQCSSTFESPHPAERDIIQTAQPQGLGSTIDSEASDIEAEQHKASSTSSPPSPSIQSRLRRRIVSGASRYGYDSDSDQDRDSQRSEADADCITCLPMSSTESSTDEEGEQSDYDDRQRSRKRRRVSKLSTGNTSWTTRRDDRSRASRIPRPASLQPRSLEDEGAVLAKFEEWPLENVVLKRVTQHGKTTFQIQFDWTLCTEHGQVGKAKRTSAPKAKYTPQEDALLIKLKRSREKLTWPEIHQRFNEAFPEGDRSQGCLQVRYSTKLKRS